MTRAGAGRLRVAVDARFLPGGLSGGIEQFTIGLVHALGELDDGDEEYVVVTPPAAAGWLDPYLGPNSRSVVLRPAPARGPLARRLAGVALRGRRALARTGLPPLRERNRFLESLDVGVVHFTHQDFKPTRLPTVYNPHDLQHLHFPEFFARSDFEHRERVYRAACRAASAVVADGRWVRDDLARAYGVPDRKLFSVLMGPPTGAYAAPSDDEVEAVRRRYSLPERFALYPAQTWPHKNHLRLAEALALAGGELAVVSTGRQNDFYATIAAEVERLGLGARLPFLGFVEPGELRALYRLARFVVFPSLFEGGGLPVLEAFHEGVAVACSTVTTLPEYAGGAALTFDPTDAAAIADALVRLDRDDELRAELVERGRRRLDEVSWARTARSYRAIYRRLAGRAPSEEDEALLAAAR